MVRPASTMNKPKAKLEWVHCNQCLRETRNEVVAKRSVTVDDFIEDYGPIYWVSTYTMLECRGCGSVTLRERTVCEDVGADDTKYYPPPVSRQLPRWHHDLPNGFQSLMAEVYAALHANSRRLALMGSRALVDLFMNETIGDIGGFERKLQKLVDDGYLSKTNKAVLEAALEAGHAAAHRAHNPKIDDLNLVVDIVENLVQTLVFKGKVESLVKNTPKRSLKR